MATKGPVINRQTCAELLQSVLRQAAEGIKFPVKEGEAVVAQLKTCLADKFISQSQYDEAINAILRVDQKTSAAPPSGSPVPRLGVPRSAAAISPSGRIAWMGSPITSSGTVTSWTRKSSSILIPSAPSC